MRTFRSGDRSSASGRSRSHAPGSSGPVIPPIAAGATYDWAIEDLALANDDPIGSWVDNIGGIDATGAGGVRPLYKTGITPNGVATARFDGVDDTLVSGAVAASSLQHLFMVAAFRDATSTAGDSPLSDSNAGYWWYVDGSLAFLYAGTPTFPGTQYRNGSATNAIYNNGRFALYELLLDTARSPGTMIFARDRSEATYGPWDISRVLIYNSEVTGADLTNTRENLILTYGIPL